MLKKLSVFVVVLAAALAPVSPAAAWEQVCVKLPRGKAAFSANFTVVHTFWTPWGLPSQYTLPDGRTERLPGRLRPSQRRNVGYGVESSSIAAGQSRCVDIAGVAQGDPFIVFIDPGLGKHTLCATHPSNPDRWYFQTNRPYRTLWYEAWGAIWSPKCEFKYESN